MTKPSILNEVRENLQSQDSIGFDPLILLSLVKKNWYWLVLGLVLALLCGRFYINHTLPVYSSSATLLINETDDNTLVDRPDILQGFGLSGAMKNLENQIMVLKSRALTESTLKELPFEVEFYFKTLRNQLPIYPEIPLKLVSGSEIPLPRDTEFSIKYLGNNMFTLVSEADYFPLNKTASFGQNIEIRKGSFSIESRDSAWLNENKYRKLCFVIYSQRRLINFYSSRLNVELLSRDGSILKISLDGTNRAKDVDFLNKHLEGFRALSLDRKNAEAQRRIQFIDDQLIGISDSLETTETRLQQFRSSHKVMDLSVQGQAIVGQATLLENERARLNLEANYYDYLSNYLMKDVTGEVPIVPVTMGISDPGLTRLVDELASLQGQLSTKGAGELNPLQRSLEQRINSTKDALRETLNGLRRANSLARSENQDRINKANAQASMLPVTERQLLGFERKFKLNDELYTFLLEARAEQEMQKASNRSDSELIDPADERFSKLISPNRMVINVFSAFLGLMIPMLILFLRFMFNTKLTEEDIRKVIDLPVIGNIPHCTESTNTVVFDNPNSIISEAFRLLRSRMQFFTKDTPAPVIMVTSTMPEDGKTFTAINLASVYSLLGKKTVLVGFDLRKPKLIKEFNLNNDKGVSTWLIGKDNLQDIIQETSYENLSVITSGPIPPNPSELTALGKVEELLKLLKEKYSYLIIDTSPIGIVSDTFHLASLADACLLVVRSRHTLRDLFANTLNEITVRGIRGMSLVINDIQSNSKQYGYVGKYGYTKESERFKRGKAKKIKI